MGKSSSEVLKEIKKNRGKEAKKLPVVKKDKKHNQIKDIVKPEIVDEVVGQIASTSTDKKDKRRDKFLLYWLLGYPVRTAGITAGYKESYAKFGLYEVLKQPIVKERLLEITSAMPEKYRALCRLRLGDVAEVEGSVINLMKDDPKLALKHPQVLKQLKKSAGVLEDEIVTPPTMTIKTLTLIRGNQFVVCEDRLNKMEDQKAIDIQPEEVTQEEDNQE